MLALLTRLARTNHFAVLRIGLGEFFYKGVALLSNFVPKLFQ